MNKKQFTIAGILLGSLVFLPATANELAIAADKTSDATAVMPAVTLEPSHIDDYKVVFEKPLFNKDRTARKQAEAPLDKKPIAVKPRVKLPTLTGIMIVEDEKQAFVTGDDAKTIVLKEGEHYGEWTVKSIQTNTVVLSNNDKEETLLLNTEKSNASEASTETMVANNHSAANQPSSRMTAPTPPSSLKARLKTMLQRPR